MHWMREYHKQVLLGLKIFLSRGLPLVLVSAAAAGIFLLKTPNSAKRASAPGARDPNATVGQYEEGMFNISINPDIRMTSGRAEAELRVENIPANHHLMSVTLSRDDTGEVLYASGLIEPGYHIQAVPLETVLPGGSYTATALFTAYDLETEQPAGQAAARVRITVAK